MGNLLACTKKTTIKIATELLDEAKDIIKKEVMEAILENVEQENPYAPIKDEPLATLPTVKEEPLVEIDTEE